MEAYPLQWPDGRPRTKRRQRSRFDTSMAVARDELMNELRLLGARLPVLSTNVALRRDGLPYSNRMEPDDPGAAIYFTYQDRQMCFACDRWDRVRDNVQAIRRTVAALRGISRWGTGDMVNMAFRGFEALPPPGGYSDAGEPTHRPWWEVLEVAPDAPTEIAEAAYRTKARKSHPDAGGSAADMAILNDAVKEARAR